MIYILAGNYSQARNYMRENRLSMKDACYVSSREQLAGLDNPKVVRVGTFHERPDSGQIEYQIRLMTRP